MPPLIALFIWLVFLLGLLIFDPANEPNTSSALWIPVIFLFFAGSRLPSQWLGGQQGMSAQAFEQGNPLDRVIFSALILLSFGVLISRSLNWGAVIVRNRALATFLLFSLLSACWSDFAFVCLKRWIRDCGGYLMVLLILSDPRPLEAVRTVLRRLSYLLIPLSIVLDKYFPALSRSYDPWTGLSHYAGVTTTKNLLGEVCVVSGLFFLWDISMRWPGRHVKRTLRIILIDTALLALTLWLLVTAESTTAKVCVVLGALVIAGANTRFFRRHPALLKALIPGLFCLYLFLDFALGMNGSMAEAVGKDPTLTDRTKIWAFLLSMHTNPIIGVGYQSFWLGPRLETFWEFSGLGHINEAHNGYLEAYLELGIVGVSLLVWFLISSYRSLWRRARSPGSFALLGVTLWLALLFYDMSEAGFENTLLWVVFLIGAITPHERVRDSARSRYTGRTHTVTLETSESRRSACQA